MQYFLPGRKICFLIRCRKVWCFGLIINLEKTIYCYLKIDPHCKETSCFIPLELIICDISIKCICHFIMCHIQPFNTKVCHHQYSGVRIAKNQQKWSGLIITLLLDVNPLTAGAEYIRVFIFYQHIKYHLLNMLKITCDINQQDLKRVDLHFVNSE